MRVRKLQQYIILIPLLVILVGVLFIPNRDYSLSTINTTERISIMIVEGHGYYNMMSLLIKIILSYILTTVVYLFTGISIMNRGLNLSTPLLNSIITTLVGVLLSIIGGFPWDVVVKSIPLLISVYFIMGLISVIVLKLSKSPTLWVISALLLVLLHTFITVYRDVDSIKFSLQPGILLFNSYNGGSSLYIIFIEVLLLGLSLYLLLKRGEVGRYKKLDSRIIYSLMIFTATLFFLSLHLLSTSNNIKYSLLVESSIESCEELDSRRVQSIELLVSDEILEKILSSSRSIGVLREGHGYLIVITNETLQSATSYINEELIPNLNQ